MEFTVLKTRVMVSPLFFAVLTAFFISDKNGIALPAVLFSFLHECGHFMALSCVKTRPRRIRFSVFGIEMELFENLSTGKKSFVLMAGFFVNYMLAAVCFLFGKVIFGYINLFIGIFTSMPLAATDGGTVLKTVLEEFSGENAERLFKIISIVFSAVSAFILSVIAVYSNNYYLFIAVIYIAASAKK